MLQLQFINPDVRLFSDSTRQTIFNPDLFPHENMEGKIDRPEAHPDIATGRVSHFRERNRGRCLTFLSRQDETLDSQRSADHLRPFYEIVRYKT